MAPIDQFLAQFKEEIPAIVKRYSSIENLLSGVPGSGEVSKSLPTYQKTVAFMQLCLRLEEVLNTAVWTRLANDPRSFERRLKKVLTNIRLNLKAVYGVQSLPHRRPTNQKRDERILAYRKNHPKATYAEIKLQLKLNMTPQAACRVCDRHEKRKPEQLRQFLEDLAATLDSLVEIMPRLVRALEQLLAQQAPPTEKNVT